MSEGPKGRTALHIHVETVRLSLNPRDGVSIVCTREYPELDTGKGSRGNALGISVGSLRCVGLWKKPPGGDGR